MLSVCHSVSPSVCDVHACFSVHTALQITSIWSRVLSLLELLSTALPTSILSKLTEPNEQVQKGDLFKRQIVMCSEMRVCHRVGKPFPVNNMSQLMFYNYYVQT